jgi:AcrR family transcriptional regulator
MEPMNLRERKKQQTRLAIVEVAHRLFYERGYRETTLADIAAEANISPRTIFSYFPSKEAIVFYQIDRTNADFERRLKNRKGKTVLEAMGEFINELRKTMTQNAEERRHHRKFIQSEPELRERAAHHNRTTEMILIREIAKELDVPTTALEPRLVAAAIRAVIEFLTSDEQLAKFSPDDGMDALQKTLDFAEAGLERIRRD